MADTEDALRRLLEKASEDPDVLAVLQHGSSLGEGPARDLDIAIVLQPEVGEEPWEASLRYHALSTGGRHEGLDVSIFQELPLYIRRRVLEHHEVLFVRDEDPLYDVATHTVKAWADFEPIYRGYLEAVARG